MSITLVTATGREDDEVLTLETSFGGYVILESLSNHDDNGNKNPTNLHIWQWKQYFCTLCTCISHLLTFSFFLWREMTFFAVVWTTWAFDDKCSILSCPKRWFQFHSSEVRTDFASVMTWNNCRNAKFNFQVTLSLSSTSSLLKLLIIRSPDDAKFSLLFQRRSTTLSLEIASFIVKILWQVWCANERYRKASLRTCCFLTRLGLKSLPARPLEKPRV